MEKRDFLQLFTTAAVAIPVAAAVADMKAAPSTANGNKESTYDRVIRTGTIRCSYLSYPPYFRKDPNTNAFSGIFYDIMQEIGRLTNLKIDWTEEVGYGEIMTGLNAGRYDLYGAGIWANTDRIRLGSFTGPLFYSALYAWVRADDTRFDNRFDLISSPDTTISVIDGAMEALIAKNDFPNAKTFSMPQSTPWITNFENVITKKADMTFAEPSSTAEFLKNNPGTLRKVVLDYPLRSFGNCLAAPDDDTKLTELLDTAIQELLFSGRIDRILAQYETTPGAFPRVALPFR